MSLSVSEIAHAQYVKPVPKISTATISSWMSVMARPVLSLALSPARVVLALVVALAPQE
jgi:anaerobic C4-dicarboxylate transporter